MQEGLVSELRLVTRRDFESPTADWTVERSVAATVTQRPGNGTHVNVELVPEAQLAPHTAYVIKAPWGLTSGFTTGDGLDQTPPPRPSFTQNGVEPYVHEGSRSDGSACWNGLGFALFSASSEGATTFRIERSGGEPAHGLPSSGGLAFTCPARRRVWEATLYAVDVAGNVSEPAAITLDERCVPEDSITGCTATASGLPLGLFAAGLSLGVLRRRAVSGRRRLRS